MASWLEFARILQEGRPLSAINPGSNEVALTFDQTLRAIGLLRGTRTAILGGDVLEKEGKIMRYATANWHSDLRAGESAQDSAARSHDETRHYVQQMQRRTGDAALYVLVLSDEE